MSHDLYHLAEKVWAEADGKVIRLDAVGVIYNALMAERYRCANIADQYSLGAEKQAALQQDPLVHDGMLMASDFCELLSDAIRNQTPWDFESGANAAANSPAPEVRGSHEDSNHGDWK